MLDVILSIMVLSAAILIAGAVYLWRKDGRTKQATLMGILAFVMIVNVVIWTVPMADGTSPVEAIDQD